jgi:hypothetical protein
MPHAASRAGFYPAVDCRAEDTPVSTRKRATIAAAVLAASLWLGQTLAVTVSGQAPARSATSEKRVWYFYTVKWGKQDRFVDLFQKNHYPILKAQVGTRFTSVKTFVPTYHGDGRGDWTFAVEIVYKDAQASITPWAEEEATLKRLYPDQAKFRAEEQERFDLLTAHWDVPLNELDLDTRKPAQ